MFPIKDQQ